MMILVAVFDDISNSFFGHCFDCMYYALGLLYDKPVVFVFLAKKNGSVAALENMARVNVIVLSG